MPLAHVKWSGQVDLGPGKLILEFLTQLSKWPPILSIQLGITVAVVLDKWTKIIDDGGAIDCIYY